MYVYYNMERYKNSYNVPFKQGSLLYAIVTREIGHIGLLSNYHEILANFMAACVGADDMSMLPWNVCIHFYMASYLSIHLSTYAPGMDVSVYLTEGSSVY